MDPSIDVHWFHGLPGAKYRLASSSDLSSFSINNLTRAELFLWRPTGRSKMDLPPLRWMPRFQVTGCLPAVSFFAPLCGCMWFSQLPLSHGFVARCGSKNRYQNGTLVIGNMDQNLRNPFCLLLSQSWLVELRHQQYCGFWVSLRQEEDN